VVAEFPDVKRLPMTTGINLVSQAGRVSWRGENIGGGNNLLILIAAGQCGCEVIDGTYGASQRMQ
jgi:hypothetical protein